MQSIPQIRANLGFVSFIVYVFLGLIEKRLVNLKQLFSDKNSRVLSREL
jgi:hypothetical protein